MAISMRLGKWNWSQFVCVALIVYHAARFAQELCHDEKMGPGVAWLCASSPMLVGLGATHHTSVLSTALTVVTARLLVRSEKGGFGICASLGLAAGSVVLARPLEGIFVVLLCGAFLGQLATRRGLADTWPKAAAYGLGGAIPAAAMVAYNLKTTGQPFISGYTLLEGEIGRFFGFGDDLMWGRSHSFSAGLAQTFTGLARMNNWLFGWPVALLVPVLALLKPFRDSRILALVAVSLVHLAAYLFLVMGSAAHDFGGAYNLWHLPWIATVAVFLVRRASSLLAASRSDFPRVSPSWPSRFATAMTVVGVAAFWPFHVANWRNVSESVRAPVEAAEEATGGKRALVLWSRIQAPGGRRSWVLRPPAAYPGDRLLWVRDDPAYYHALRVGYPDRAIYRLDWRQKQPVVVPFSPLPR